MRKNTAFFKRKLTVKVLFLLCAFMEFFSPISHMVLASNASLFANSGSPASSQPNYELSVWDIIEDSQNSVLAAPVTAPISPCNLPTCKYYDGSSQNQLSANSFFPTTTPIYLNAGDHFSIRAGGYWCYKNGGAPFSVECTGPNGATGDPNQAGALYWQVGDSPWAFAGALFNGYAPTSGNLKLRMQDTGCLSGAAGQCGDNGYRAGYEPLWAEIRLVVHQQNSQRKSILLEKGVYHASAKISGIAE
jgi:hypothetical protein